MPKLLTMPERLKNILSFKYIAFLLFLVASGFAEAQLVVTDHNSASNYNTDHHTVTACGTGIYKVTFHQDNANQQGRIMITWNGYPIGKINNSHWGGNGWAINQVHPNNNNGTIAVGGNADQWWYFEINTINQTAYGYTSDFACDAAPTVTTDVGSITCNSASFEGDVTDGGTATVTERGFIHGTNNTDVSNAQYGSLGSASLLTVGSGNGTFSSARTGLSSGTTYYLKSYAINSVGTSYGSVESFTPSFTIASTASASRLGAGTLAISATTNSGTGDVRWYDVPSGGSALPNTSASGADWTTPSITETVTYYAEAYIGSCTSSRVASIATVNYAPGGVSNNLLLWLKADVGVTGTDPVTGWADQSGNGFNAVVGGNGPRLVTNSMNFQPTINFDHDNNEWMKITDGIFGNNTKTTMFAYVVIKMPSVTSPYHLNAVFGQKLRGNSSNGWSTRDFLFLPVWGTTSYWQLGNNVISHNSAARIQVNSSNAGVVVDKPQLWSLGSHSTTSTPEGKKKYINFNGAHVTSQNWYNSTAQGQTGDANYDFRIGNWQRSSGNMFHGDIAEIVIYD
jgi:hypothetical protein